MNVSQYEHNKTAIASDLGLRFHPGLRQVASQVQKGADIPWDDCVMDCIRSAAVGFQPGMGHGRSHITRRDAKGQKSGAYFEVYMPSKSEVLEGHC
jgi:hypothetical protein